MKNFSWRNGLSLMLIVFSTVLQTRGVTANATSNTSCPVTQFQCDNDECIAFSWKCDQDPDCEDGSDEKNCPSTTCAEDEYKCHNGKCIPQRWTCDKDPDCSDRSDESNELCNNRTCGPNQFSCPSGVCISSDWICDGESDCDETHGEDEKDCRKTCTGDAFQCDSGQCIAQKWRCDFDKDCKDGSDENNCPPPPTSCKSDQFQCHDGTCINKEWVCDGDFDCNDKSDESDIMTCNETTSHCSVGQFQCKSGECIHEYWRCDGDDDCEDDSDEDCIITCRPNEFLCEDYKYCLPNSVRCDGNYDCVNGTDEINCTTKCTEDQFDCGDSTCIARDMVCDGKPDCPNLSDESQDLGCDNDPCKTNNGGCDHKCVNLFRNKHRCECDQGFTFMEGSTTVCEDINECKDNNIHGTCSQTCINTKGSYKCECLKNYSLVNHRYCKAVGHHPELLLANTKDLRRIHLENFGYKLLLDDAEVREAIAMDFDFEANKFYWTDVALESIFRADLNSTNKSSVEVVVNHSVNIPDGLAVDWINKYIYWTDTGSDKIEVASLDGKMRKTLIDTGLDEPRALALDPNNGYMYWTDWGELPKIERCGLNGEDREVIVKTNITWPNGLTIDYAANRLYWIDAKLHTIESANMDGSQRVTVLKSHHHLSHPFAITVFEDYLYWTDWPSESVRKVSKFVGQNSVETIVLDLHSPMDIHVLHPYRQITTKRGKEFCGEVKQGCSHFCLPKALKNPAEYKSGSDHYTCGCPDGMRLQYDGKTCEQGSEISTGVPHTTGSHTTLPPQTESPNRSHNRSSHGPVKTTVSIPVTTASVEVSSEGPGGYTVVTPHNETKPNTPEHMAEENMGHIAGIVIGVLLVLIVIAGVVCFILYRKYSRNHGKSMNFDNPVYRKTTTEELIIEKNRPNLPASLQPLTSSPNEVV